nr:unnamed protein product [Naegleria fowleri]
MQQLKDITSGGEKAIDRIIKIIDETPSLGHINKTQLTTMLHFLEVEAEVKDKALKIKLEETKACREILSKLQCAQKQSETDIKLINNNRDRLKIAVETLKAKTEEIKREDDILLETILEHRRSILDLENFAKQQESMIKETRQETKAYLDTNAELNQIKETTLKERFLRINQKERAMDRFKRHVTIVRKNLIHDPYLFFGAADAEQGADIAERNELVFGNNFGANAKERFKKRRNSTGNIMKN